MNPAINPKMIHAMRHMQPAVTKNSAGPTFVPTSTARPRVARPLRGIEAGILLNEHFADDGPTVFEHACRLGAEGIVSKKVDGTYRSGPCPVWMPSVAPGGDRGLLHRPDGDTAGRDRHTFDCLCSARPNLDSSVDPVPRHRLAGAGIGSWYRFASWRSPISPGDRIAP